MVTEEIIDWTRDALTHVYNTPFLERHLSAECARERFAGWSGAELRQHILKAIESLRPVATASIRSTGWRQYDILRLRYLEGLLQAEVAARLHVSLRHLKREQQRAIESAAEALFAGRAAGEALPGQAWVPETDALILRSAIHSYAREQVLLSELLQGALELVDVVLQNQHVRVNLAYTAAGQAFPPRVLVDPILARQLLISALGWLVQDVVDQTLDIEVYAEPGIVGVRMSKPLALLADARAHQDSVETSRRLASALQVHLATGAGGARAVLDIRFPAQSQQCVLMIDDDPDAIRLAQRSLQRSDEFFLVGVTEPDEAIAMIPSLQPACVLLDLMMPGRDGWEILRWLRAQPECAELPIIVSSVLDESRLARALGATGVLPRPFSVKQLLSTLRSVIR